MTSQKIYHEYLKKRKFISLLYKCIFIYPFFLKYIGNKNIDFGCGCGDFIKFCSFFNKKITGVDINNYNVRYCKKLNLDAFHINVDDLLEKKN